MSGVASAVMTIPVLAAALPGRPPAPDEQKAEHENRTEPPKKQGQSKFGGHDP
jgi:hypothetical protein